MEKKIIFLVLALFTILLTGCSSENNEVINTQENMDSESYEESSEVTTSENEVNNDSNNIDLNIEERRGIFTDTVRFGDGEVLSGEIKKFRNSKTAEIELTNLIPKEQYSMEMFGDEIYSAPMLVNMLCGLFDEVLFDPQALEDRGTELEENEAESVFDYIEDDYEITKMSINFIHKEENSPIARCVSTGKGTLEFVAYRDYENKNTFLGAQIGVFED